ncbi:MAG: hypothetical protein IJH61_02195 [Eubacteriaceae bacterium]|nr:hypothetical protein [Eubacteriaceae bacterium]
MSEPKKDEDKPKAVLPKENGSDQGKTAPPKKNNKTIFIIVGIVVGIIAIGALIYCFATGILPPKTTVPIAFKINIDNGFNNESTPIVAKITDKSNKDNVTYAAFTSDGGSNTEVNVPQGEYDITLISPINADGSIYDMGKTVTVNTESENERNVSTSCKRVPADNVTSEQLQEIVDALNAANQSAKLPDNALDNANKRLDSKKEAEAKQKLEQEAYDSIIEQYNNAIAAHYTVSQLDNEKLTDKIGRDFYGSSSNNSGSFGYALMDLDGDGIRELLIGEVGKPNIYDMYAIKNRQAERLFYSRGRSYYNYAGGNKILHDGSNGAASHVWELYEYNQGLVQIDGAESKGSYNGSKEVVDYYVFNNGDWRTTDQSEYTSKYQSLEAMKETYEMTLFPASQ